ncbi:AraC family transcriptional regulator [bacterium]|nr:AraC family transcriptional regulator [bacterium]
MRSKRAAVPLQQTLQPNLSHSWADGLTILKRNYYYSLLGLPWSIRAGAGTHSSFHLLASGRGEVCLPATQQRYHLEQGDLIFLPWGSEHVVCSHPELEPENLADFILRTQPVTAHSIIRHHPGQPPGCKMICGVFQVGNLAYHPVYRHLPVALVIPGENGEPLAWIQNYLEQLEEEVERREAGYESVLDKLFDLLFLEILAHWLQDEGDHLGVTQALGDPYLGPCLERIHQRPEADWTVAEMARQAGLSRTAFAERFHRRVGVTPISYVTEWRLWRALHLIESGEHGLESVARETGFSDESSLSRAFRRRFGRSVREFRKGLKSS